MARYKGTASYEVSRDKGNTWAPCEVEAPSWLYGVMQDRSPSVLFYPQDGLVYRIRYTPNEE